MHFWLAWHWAHTGVCTYMLHSLMTAYPSIWEAEVVSLAYIERPCLKDEKGELAQEGKASDLSLSPESCSEGSS